VSNQSKDQYNWTWKDRPGTLRGNKSRGVTIWQSDSDSTVACGRERVTGKAIKNATAWN
jgi:hypothetical protein